MQSKVDGVTLKNFLKKKMCRTPIAANSDISRLNKANPLLDLNCLNYKSIHRLYLVICIKVPRDQLLWRVQRKFTELRNCTSFVVTRERFPTCDYPTKKYLNCGLFWMLGNKKTRKKNENASIRTQTWDLWFTIQMQ